MSLILDALNRAENERNNQNTVPTLTSVHASVDLTPADPWWKRHGRWLFIALLIALVILGWFVSQYTPTQLAPTTPRSDNMPAVTESDSSPALSQTTAEPEPPVVAATQSGSENDNGSTAVVAVSAVTTQAVNVAPVAVEQLYQAAPEALPDEVASLYGEETSTESVAIVDPFAAPPQIEQGERGHITQPLRAGPLAAERTFNDLMLIQDFNELPWATKQQVPTISYQRHNYLNEAVSTVVINGQTLGEGNVLGGTELVVQEIVKDGVVIRFGATVFKLRALNGWINM